MAALSTLSLHPVAERFLAAAHSFDHVLLNLFRQAHGQDYTRLAFTPLRQPPLAACALSAI